MSLRGLSPRFWVAAALVAFVFLVGFVGPLIVSTTRMPLSAGCTRSRSAAPSSLVPTTKAKSVIANLVTGTHLADRRTNRGSHWHRHRPAGRSGRRLPRRLAGRCAERHCERRPGHPGACDRDLGFGVAAATQPLHLGTGDRIYWLVLGRARAYGQSSSIRTREHIDVAKLSGAGFWSILRRDVLPYLLSYVVMACILQISSAILFESTLSMLGLGASSTTSLGTMLYWAIQWGSVRTGAWWAFIPPTLMLTLIVFSLLLCSPASMRCSTPGYGGVGCAKRAKDEGEGSRCLSRPKTPARLGRWLLGDTGSAGHGESR